MTNANPTLAIAVFDANPMLAAGVCALLEQTAGFHGRAITLHDNGNISLPVGFSPDVVMIDPGQTTLSPMELMARLSGPGDPVALIGYASQMDIAMGKACIGAGFRGYLPKTATIGALRSALDAVMRGGIYLDAALAGAFIQSAPSQPQRTSDIRPLTDREAVVLKSVALGMSMKEIGNALALSTKTVETYKARASSKLNLQSRRDIVNFAIRNGWVQNHI